MWVAFCKVSQEDRSLTKYMQAANIKAVGLWATWTCVPADLHHLFPKSILLIQITAPWSLTYPHWAREGMWCDQKTYNYWGVLTFFFFSIETNFHSFLSSLRISMTLVLVLLSLCQIPIKMAEGFRGYHMKDKHKRWTKTLATQSLFL